MSRRARMGVFAVGAAGLGALLVAAMGELPAFGRFNGVYSLFLNHFAVAQRHATDVVTAVVFDYRAFDTMGEEFILFAAVAGLAVLLREQRGERALPAERAEAPGTSHALRALAALLVGPVVVLSVYVSAHGALTPGGGFQGGVIGAAGLLLVLLGGSYVAMRRLSPQGALELGEAAGAAGYGLIGLGGLLFASAYFENFLGLGTPGELISAGTMPLSSLAVGLEVAGAFVLLWAEFADQAMIVRARR